MSESIEHKLYAAELIKEEATALLKLSEEINDSFNHAVEIILGSAPSSRVIVSGIGKAGIIAQKISATLSSLGISSFFMHPTEALHGDLGKITKQDIALLLSNSGETHEILNLVIHLKKLAVSIISITKSDETPLGRNSDVVLSLGELKEVGPFNLAPTTSTLAMLSLGDALCMSLAKARGFSKEAFSVFHPGGNLGKSLLIVQDVMRKDDELCIISSSTLVKDTLNAITSTKGRPGAAAIINSEGVLVGIFTDGDLRRCLKGEISFLEKPISEFMGKTPKVVTAKSLILEAIELIEKHRIDQLLVIDEERKPVGLLDIQDVYRIGFLKRDV